MKKTLCALVSFVLFCGLVSAQVKTLSPQPDPPGRSFVLPKGTKVQQLGPGLFKFMAPDGQALQVRIVQKAGPGNYVLGESSLFDKFGKLLCKAKGGTLVGAQKPLDPNEQVNPQNYVKIDDDVTWLPATAKLTEIVNPDPPPSSVVKNLTLARGTTAQKLGTGLFKFLMPDGQALQVRIVQKASPGNYVLGESSFFDKFGKLLYKAKGGTLAGSQKPADPNDQTNPLNYVKIDDDVSWLPIMLKLTGVINPDPPGIP